MGREAKGREGKGRERMGTKLGWLLCYVKAKRSVFQSVRGVSDGGKVV